jgi:hypothetical protein
VRLTPKDDPPTAALKLAEGIPGAIIVLVGLRSKVATIDPVESWFNYMETLDRCEIYGGDIWRLYKGSCDSKPGRFAVLLRSVDLGILTPERVRAAATSDSPTPFDFADLVGRIRFRIPAFARDGYSWTT